MLGKGNKMIGFSKLITVCLLVCGGISALVGAIMLISEYGSDVNLQLIGLAILASSLFTGALATVVWNVAALRLTETTKELKVK
jgi:hypothetical protein